MRTWGNGRSILQQIQCLPLAILLLCLSMANGALAGVNVDTLVLKNRFVRFDFSPRDGSLVQITDLKTGTEWLNPSKPHRLVKLIQRTPDKSSNILLSNEAGPPKCDLSDDTLILRFPPLRDQGQSTDIYLTVTVHLPAASAEALFTLEIDNQGKYPIVESWFPFVGARTANEGREDVFTTSYGKEPGMYERFDHGTFDTHAFGQHLQRIGMGAQQLLPFMDITTERGGLSYLMYEKNPRPTELVYENLSGDPSNADVGWSWSRNVLLEPGRKYLSSNFGIGVHQSDWHATADLLRRFMDTWWHASPRSALLREKIGLFQIQIKGFNGEPYNDFDDLPAIARDVQKYGIADLMFWDYTASVYCRPDAAGDFWEMPVAREKMLRRALAEVRGLGFQVSACVNYRLINETSKAWQRIGSEAQYSFFGIPLYGNASGSMNGAIYLNRLYDQGARSLCQGTDRFQQYAMDLTRQTLDLGLNSLFIDQAFESSYALPKERRELDTGKVMDRAYGWFGDAAQLARAKDPQAYAIAEVPDLWNVQTLDAWWVWGWNQKGWPSLEVFKYVMPEVTFVWCTDEFQRPLLSKGFALGSFLAIGTRGLTGRLSDAPEYAEQIARLGRLRKKVAPFVAQGRFVDKRGLSITGGEAYAFTSEAGIAITFSNGANSPANLVTRLNPALLTSRALGKGSIHFEDGRDIPANPTLENGQWILPLALEAYAAAIWTIPYAN